MFARGDSSGVGERGHSIEPRRVVLLCERRHRGPRDGRVVRGERRARAPERLEIGGPLPVLGPRAAHRVFDPQVRQQARRARLDHGDSGIAEAPVLLGKRSEPRPAHRGEGQPLAESVQRVERARAGVAVHGPGHAPVEHRRAEHGARSEQSGFPGARAAQGARAVAPVLHGHPAQVLERPVPHRAAEVGQVGVVLHVSEANQAVPVVHVEHERLLEHLIEVHGRVDHLPRVARPRREREARRHPRVGGQQGLERDRDEDALVAVIAFVSDPRVHHIGDRIPRAQFHPDAKAPLDLEPRPEIAGEKPAGAHGERGLIRKPVMQGRERGHGLVIPETEAPVEVALLDRVDAHIERPGRAALHVKPLSADPAVHLLEPPAGEPRVSPLGRLKDAVQQHVIDSQPGTFRVLREVRADVRKRAVIFSDRVADILVQDKVQPGIQKEPVGQLAVICREQAEAVLKNLRPVQVGAQSRLDPKHVQAGVLAF